MKNIKSFWVKYNGATSVIVWLPLLFVSSTALNSKMDIPFPFWEITLNLIVGVCKIFLAEFLGSVMLKINQKEYFNVVHEPEVVDTSKLTPGWRDTAYKYYALYCLGAYLVLAFA